MPIIIPANSAASGGFEVANSCVFDSASSDYLYDNDNFANNTSTKKFTISFWVKRSSLGGNQSIYSSRNDNSYSAVVKFKTDNTIEVSDVRNDSDALQVVTNRVFRDTSAWYHIVVSSDVSISSPVLKIYVNGVQETSFATSNQYSQNETTSFNNAYPQQVASHNGDYFDGYLAQVAFIDGYAYAADSFGEFDDDSGVWKPINISALTTGANGRLFKFEDSSALANNSYSSSNFTVANLTAINQTTDTCTNNFATWNNVSTWRGSNITTQSVLSQGNLKISGMANANKVQFQSTIGVKSGKWYWEAKVDSVSKMFYGVANSQGMNESNSPVGGTLYIGVFYYENTPYFAYSANSSESTTGIASISSGDILNFALDCNEQTFYIGKNGTYMNSGNPASGGTGTGAINRLFNYASSLFALNGAPTEMFPTAFVSSTSGTGAAQYNFGNPTYTGTDKSDDNDKGSFEYQPPAGYLALCTANLSETNS